MNENKKTIIACVIWTLGFILLVMNFASCKAYSRAIGFGGNPDPNMKSIHMATAHEGYSRNDYDQHPDHDCNGTYTNIKTNNGK